PRVKVSGTLGGFPNPPAMVRGERSSPAPHASRSREPWEGSRTLPRWYAASEARRLPTRQGLGNPGRVPEPSRDGTRRAKLAGSPRVKVSGTLGGFPNPPAMVRGERSSPAPHASRSREPWEGSRTLPRWYAASEARRLPTRQPTFAVRVISPIRPLW